LCAEIALSDSKDKSFVCCLSSINLLHRDAIKHTDAIETMIFFLDAVMEEFIINLEERRDSEDIEEREKFEFMKRAYKFAKEERAL
jgi:ribonucleoside-diphosphate reductase alpha chain